MSTFAVVALVLAAIGVYGVLSYMVRRRRQEIAIRVALGASTTSIRVDVLRRGLALAIGGAAIGAILSIELARWAGSQVPGLGTAEPATTVAAAVILVVVAAIACDVPARRATRIDPITALRNN
jgi:putative ABC transport system permease protein